MKAREEAPADAFEGYKTVSMVGTNEEVLDHYPPQFIVGQPLEDMTQEIYEEDIDDVTVKMYALTCEYMYSNPTGLYNLSLPDRKLRNHLNFRQKERTYVEWKNAQKSGTAAEFEQADETNVDGEEDENRFDGFDVRQWHDHSLVGEVLIKLEILNRGRDQLKVEIGVEQDESDNTPLNCRLPITSYYQQILSSNISAKPIAALIQKIDPTKPFGKIKLTVGVKHIRSGSSNLTGGLGGIQTYGNVTDYGVSGVYSGLDPTNTQAYRDVVSSIRNGIIGD